MLCGFKNARVIALQCEQLEERVKAHELDAGMLIEYFLGHFLEG